MLNNAKPYFFLNEMNKKDLPAMYSTAFWCLINDNQSSPVSFREIIETSRKVTNLHAQSCPETSASFHNYFSYPKKTLGRKNPIG